MNHSYITINQVKKIIFPILLALFSYQLKAQNCGDYGKKSCSGYGEPFTMSKQSRSALFELGQSSELYFVAYGKYDYNVTVCHDRRLGDVYFRIKEDNPAKSILYDSSVEDKDELSKQFYVENTKRLIIEVVVPESIKDVDYEDRYGCIAVVIEFNRQNKKGF